MKSNKLSTEQKRPYTTITVKHVVKKLLKQAALDRSVSLNTLLEQDYQYVRQFKKSWSDGEY